MGVGSGLLSSPAVSHRLECKSYAAVFAAVLRFQLL